MAEEQQNRHLRFDWTINPPSLLTIGGLAFSCLWWLANIQFQLNQNTQAIAEWKVTWTQFTTAREQTVRNYEQRMTTQEQLGRDIMRRLDSIDQNLIRLTTIPRH